jgi:hypothetical protein
MYCENCGKKLEEGSSFCENCGRKATTVLEVAPTPTGNKEIKNENIFYSKDWRRKNVVVIATLPYFDVMVDDKDLYLFQMPKSSASTIGLIVGLLVLNVIGAAGGYWIGDASYTKKRKDYRATWLNSDSQLTSTEYNQAVYLKVPLVKLKGNLTQKKRKVVISYDGKEITLQKNKDEIERLNAHIEKYGV